MYYPYADEHLTLVLSDDPEDRPIAAEFVIRADPDDFYMKKGLGVMDPPSLVRISTNVIRLDDGFWLFELRYRRLPGFRKPRLEMESKSMRLVFEKVCDVPGDIRESGVLAPIRWYPPEKIAVLERRYRKLREQLKKQPH